MRSASFETEHKHKQFVNFTILKAFLKTQKAIHWNRNIRLKWADHLENLYARKLGGGGGWGCGV